MCTEEKFKFSQILLGDKNATALCFKNISTLSGISRSTLDFGIDVGQEIEQ